MFFPLCFHRLCFTCDSATCWRASPWAYSDQWGVVCRWQRRGHRASKSHQGLWLLEGLLSPEVTLRGLRPSWGQQHLALVWISASGIPASKLVEAHGSFASATCTVCRRPFPGEDFWVSCHTDSSLPSAFLTGSKLEKWCFVSIMSVGQQNSNTMKMFSFLN